MFRDVPCCLLPQSAELGLSLSIFPWYGWLEFSLQANGKMIRITWQHAAAYCSSTSSQDTCTNHCGHESCLHYYDSRCHCQRGNPLHAHLFRRRLISSLVDNTRLSFLY